LKILVTGANGFLGGYLVAELLQRGHEVVGLDNFSKYGRVAKSYDGHKSYRLVEGDAKDSSLLKSLLSNCDHFVAGAAMIGGIGYFTRYAYDLLAENERITAASLDAAIEAHRKGRLQKITMISSSMVYENATVFPTPEGEQSRCPPPNSSYGFQKLACEYFVKAATEQHDLPHTILRPFNCVGIGESRALGGGEEPSRKLALSHVVPDLITKVIQGQEPLHILGDGTQRRHYTYGGDLARGIAMAMEHPKSKGEDFNLSTAVSTSVLELAQLIWRKVNGNKPLRTVSDPPFPHDVQRREPDVTKAKTVLGFEATTPLETVLDEVIPWIRAQVAAGRV
jgi:nucleoside-diphosphate-sugar epimerase